MPHSQNEIIFSEFTRSLNDSPRYGTVSFVVHFTDSEVTRIERGRIEGFKMESRKEPIEPLLKPSIPEKIVLDKPPRLISVKETAARLGISVPTLYRNIKTGRINVIHIGGRVLVSTKELDRIMNGVF